MHEFACKHRQAGVYSKHTYAALRLHTQTHIRGHFSLWRSSTRSNTHTCRARRPDGITAWVVGLSHSGDLISHRFFSFTRPFPLSFVFFCTLSSLSTLPCLGFTSSVLSIWPFLLLSYCRLFHFANNTWQKVDCSDQIVHFTVRQAFFWRLSFTPKV